MVKRYIKIILLLIVVIYVLFCATVYFYPQYFFYNPSSKHPDLSEAMAKGFTAQEVVYASADGTELYGWFVKPHANKKIIVYFHGNSHDIGKFYNKLIPLINEGYGAFIGEYRGFGGIKGEVNEKNIAADAKAAVDYLHLLGYKNSSLILYGMSLGSYSAINTAYTKGRDESFAALILEVPFDSLLNVVRDRILPFFPFKMLIKDHYDNVYKSKHLDLPVLVMGAEKDTVVPINRAKNLYSQIKGRKAMIIYPDAEHSNLYDYQNYKDILNWLKNNEKTE